MTRGDTNDPPTAFDTSTYRSIELVWPGKDVASSVRQDRNGQWHVEPAPAVRRLHPFVDITCFNSGRDGSCGWVVSGDRLAALTTLRRSYARSVTLAYLDIPRVEVDDQAAAFHGDAVFAYSTWLSVVRAHIDAVVPLVNRAGTIAVLAGDLEEPYVRMLLSEVVGRNNYIGTVVWQRSYGPRNMRGMKEFTATHDRIVLFGIDKALWIKSHP